MTATQSSFQRTKTDAQARIVKMQSEVDILSNAAKRLVGELDESLESELIINAVECQAGRIQERIAREVATIEHCNFYLN